MREQKDFEKEKSRRRIKTLFGCVMCDGNNACIEVGKINQGL